LPVWSPTPVARMVLLRVRCLIIARVDLPARKSIRGVYQSSAYPPKHYFVTIYCRTHHKLLSGAADSLLPHHGGTESGSRPARFQAAWRRRKAGMSIHSMSTSAPTALAAYTAWAWGSGRLADWRRSAVGLSRLW